VQLAVADVDGHDMLRATLEQAVGEAAGGGAGVERVTPRHAELQRIEGVGELHAAARDVVVAGIDAHVHVARDHLAGLVRAPARAAKAHLAGHDRRGRPRPRLEQAALREQEVEPALRHPAERTRARKMRAHREKCARPHTTRTLLDVISLPRSSAVHR
jgi:hypothetical protein